MKKIAITIILGISFISCKDNLAENTIEKNIHEKTNQMTQVKDERISLELNPMQKQHQLKNMRSHLEAVQEIIKLLSTEKYDEASKIAYTKLGSTTEMRLMCSSFGNKTFENLGLEFHKSADKMSEIFKNRDKEKALNALSNTMNYCIQCHTIFRQ